MILLLMYILYMVYVYRQMSLKYWSDIGFLSKERAETIELLYWAIAITGLNLLVNQVVP